MDGVGSRMAEQTCLEADTQIGWRSGAWPIPYARYLHNTLTLGCEDPGWVARVCGTSEQMIFRHYRKLDSRPPDRRGPQGQRSSVVGHRAAGAFRSVPQSVPEQLCCDETREKSGL